MVVAHGSFLKCVLGMLQFAGLGGRHVIEEWSTNSHLMPHDNVRTVTVGLLWATTDCLLSILAGAPIVGCKGTRFSLRSFTIVKRSKDIFWE